MKKGIAILALAATPVLAANVEMPTVYGKINKVLAYTDQDANDNNMINNKSMDGITDVHNSESRMGVKGNAEVMHTTAKYKIELGLNSTKQDETNKTKERIRIREAAVWLKSNVGTFTYGQTYTALAKQGKRFDPLEQTIAGHQGDDQKSRIELATDDLGFNYRSRKDLIGYTSPSLHGLTYQVTVDRNDQMSSDPDDSNTYGATHYEHLVRYQRELGAMDLELYVGKHNWSSAGTKDNDDMSYGLELSHGAFTFAVAMGTVETTTSGATDVKSEVERMFSALSWEKKDHKVSFTYQTRTNSTDGDDTDEYTQMALGYKHICNKNVDLNFTVGTYETENKSEATADAKAAKSNKTTFAGLGIQLKF